MKTRKEGYENVLSYPDQQQKNVEKADLNHQPTLQKVKATEEEDYERQSKCHVWS